MAAAAFRMTSTRPEAATAFAASMDGTSVTSRGRRRVARGPRVRAVALLGVAAGGDHATAARLGDRTWASRPGAWLTDHLEADARRALHQGDVVLEGTSGRGR